MAVLDHPAMLEGGRRSQPEAEQAVAPPPPPPPLPPAVVRPYNHALDSARLAYICRNVYGGTDDLPQRVASLHSQPGAHLLAACMSGEDSPLDALLCCQERGDVLWLFGARTAEELRGNGLAGLLLVEAEALAHTLPRAAALLSITVPANRTMRRLFARRGFRQQRRVVAWPETPVALAAHEQMAGAAAAQQQQAQRAQQREQQQAQRAQRRERQQEQQAQQQQGASPPPMSFLQSLPAAAAVVDTPAARALLPSWRRCASVAELQAVLLRLRQCDPQRQQQHGSEAEDDGSAAALGSEEDLTSGSAGEASDEGAAHQTAAAVQGAAAAAAAAPAVQAAAGAGPVTAELPADSRAFLWVPGEYELLPAGGPAVQQLVEEGAVWLLQGPSTGAAIPASEADSAAAAADCDVLAAGTTAGAADAAVLVCYGPGFRSMRHAGIVAGSPAALESALLHASAEADPRCCRFYIDACGFDHPQLWASTGGPRIDILPFFRPLKPSG